LSEALFWYRLDSDGVGRGSEKSPSLCHVVNSMSSAEGWLVGAGLPRSDYIPSLAAIYISGEKAYRRLNTFQKLSVLFVCVTLISLSGRARRITLIQSMPGDLSHLGKMNRKSSGRVMERGLAFGSFRNLVTERGNLACPTMFLCAFLLSQSQDCIVGVTRAGKVVSVHSADRFLSYATMISMTAVCIIIT
jgi:hypothetical protein